MLATRRIDRAARLSALSPEVRAEVLESLDEFSRPLTRREIEKLLAPFLTRKERQLVVPLLMHVNLIAIVPADGASAGD